jgi:hypothetical protein
MVNISLTSFLFLGEFHRVSRLNPYGEFGVVISPMEIKLIDGPTGSGGAHFLRLEPRLFLPRFLIFGLQHGDEVEMSTPQTGLQAFSMIFL